MSSNETLKHDLPKAEEIKDHKRVKASQDAELERFLTWCKTNNVTIDYEKVEVTKVGSSHNYGMFAIVDLPEKTCIARIPKAAILEPHTTAIKSLIAKHGKELKSSSNWSKLIISLMHEYTLGDKSKWAPYLDLFPPKNDLFDLPMFWENETRSKLLANTCVLKNVQSDLTRMHQEFEKAILPFVKKNSEFFDQKCQDFEFYKQIVAFIMAYSFRDPSEDEVDDESKIVGPMMVPVADILNHIAKNNAHLEFTDNELIICTTKAIKKGEEVYNTYGEHSNTDLLHMYGFSEVFPENIFDSVEIPTKDFVKAWIKEEGKTTELMQAKIDAMKEADLIDDDMCIAIGEDGVLNEEECLHVLQIYSMPKDEFVEFCENEYELLEDEEWDKFSLLTKNIKSIPLDWRHILKSIVEIHLEDLKTTLNAIQKATQGETRVTYSRNLIEGHMNLLNVFLKALD